MTERKPPGVSWQTWIDRQIEDAQSRGEFDGLDGLGKPLPGVDEARDELWWVREKLKREKVEHLPPTLKILKDRADAIADAVAAPTEAEARSVLEAMNDRIRYENAHVVVGPPSTAVPIDIDRVLDRRRRERGPDAPDDGPTLAEHEPDESPGITRRHLHRRWPRLARRRSA